MWWKVEEWESVSAAMVREIEEEVLLSIPEEQLISVWILHFIVEKEPHHSSDIHLFKIVDFEGEPQKTQEIEPAWFPIVDIPYDKMWEDDKTWLPRIIDWETDIEYDVIFETVAWWIKEMKQIK